MCVWGGVGVCLCVCMFVRMHTIDSKQFSVAYIDCFTINSLKAFRNVTYTDLFGINTIYMEAVDF